MSGCGDAKDHGNGEMSLIDGQITDTSDARRNVLTKSINVPIQDTSQIKVMQLPAPEMFAMHKCLNSDVELTVKVPKTKMRELLDASGEKLAFQSVIWDFNGNKDNPNMPVFGKEVDFSSVNDAEGKQVIDPQGNLTFKAIVSFADANAIKRAGGLASDLVLTPPGGGTSKSRTR